MTATMDVKDACTFLALIGLCFQVCLVNSEEQRRGATLPAPDIYVPMDSIEWGETPAVGVYGSTWGDPAPSIQPGIFNNSIFIANNQSKDDTYLDLGKLRHRCADYFPDCQDGLTVSIWYWLDNQSPEDATLISATMWLLGTRKLPGNVNEPYLIFYKTKRRTNIVGGYWNSTFANEQWHNVAFVYRSNDKVKLYVDGKLNAETSRHYIDWNLVVKDIDVGCHLGSLCARAKFDDLKIWEKAFSDEEIELIYNQMNSTP